ncbi:BTB/POZ fold protein [Ascosphaera apis ARSEF 7405]|uniref:BTB/POZ fold protein n=1 Tax=Ascosphaera apis ARSEF 7405 TaxID=392613 RepID=A0A162ISZ0_9EURO|nr:BTB/POZ fold protein [Ascosphaera apis ARSEF 7405]
MSGSERMSDIAAEERPATARAEDATPKLEAEGEEQPTEEKHSEAEEIERSATQQESVEQSQTQEQSEQQETVEQSQEQSQKQEQEQEQPEQQEEKKPEEPRKLTFLDYLKSPIIELVVGQGDKKTTLTAHQALLAESPYIKDIIESEDTPVGQIFLPDESVEAVGCFLQYQYKGEYIVYPSESSTDTDEDSGEELLRHARVFFLASKFGHTELKRLARHKIHRVESTPRGEIAYARYVYSNQSPDAAELRRPVANFWASNEAMRDEVREEFKAVCLDFPEFSYDILSSDKKRPAAASTPSKDDRQTAAKRRRSRRN